jgi:hypothetical protein
VEKIKNFGIVNIFSNFCDELGTILTLPLKISGYEQEYT